MSPGSSPVVPAATAPAQEALRTDYAGFRWLLAPGFEPLLKRVFDMEGEDIKRTPERWVVRCSVAGRVFYRKHVRYSLRWIAPSSFWFRQPRSRVDWQLAARLRDLKVPVVPFLAYGERWTWRGLAETVLITEGPPGFRPLHLECDLSGDTIQQALGRFLRSVHDAGVAMRDLHARNLLYAPDSQSFCLMDLDTVSIQPQVEPAERMDHLARLHSRVPLTGAFYDAYGRDAPIDPETIRQRAPLLRRMRCLKHNRDFQPWLAGGLRWHVRTAALSEPLRKILADPGSVLSGGGALLKHSDNSTVAAAGGFVLKRFHSRKPINVIKDSFRRSRAVRAFLKAYHLELAGITTPRAIAVASRRARGIFPQSYFVMEEVQGAIHLRSWRGHKRSAITAVAQLVARLHDAGFSHSDLKETNILFDQSGAPHLIDIDGLHYVRRVDQPRAVADLTRLAKGALRLPAWTRADRARFVIEYCRARNYADWRALWTEIAQRVDPAAPPLPPLHQQWVRLGGDGLGYVRADWWHAFQEAGLQTISAFLNATGEPLSKPGLGGRYRARLRIRSGEQEHCFYLKRYEREPLGTQIKRWFEDACLASPAERDVRVAAALAQCGLEVPHTVAWGRTRRFSMRQQSFIVATAVAGDAIDRRVLAPPFTEPAKSFSAKRALVRELAKLVRTFHEAGWRHRDLYLCHVFADIQGERMRLSMIDLQRVFRPRWRVWRWRIKDLAQLNYSAKPEQFSRAMRLRFAKEYFGAETLAPFHRRILQKVVRKTRSIARRDERLRT